MPAALAPNDIGHQALRPGLAMARPMVLIRRTAPTRRAHTLPGCTVKRGALGWISHLQPSDPRTPLRLATSARA